MLEYGPFRNDEDEQRFRAIAVQAFEFPTANWSTYVERMGRENLRVVRRGDTVVGGLGYYPMGQWFGGKSVRMAGIAVVAVPPEERASGIAADLMTQTLRELRALDFPISTLYPATQRLYRKVGYEQAGNLTTFEMPIARIGVLGRELPIEPISFADRARLLKADETRSRMSNGLLDRSDGMWARLLDPVGAPTYIYGAVAGQEVEGYVVFQQNKVAMGYDLDLRDFNATTPRALRSLWTFLNDHRSLGQKMSWHGPSSDPVQAPLFEQRGDYTPMYAERWMLRVLNVATALEARGYREDIDANLSLVIEDDLFPENAGTYRLEVAKGLASVTRGGTGDALRMHVRGLAPLYSSLFPARQLASLGWIEGSDAALRAAETIFHGPEPWMTEGF